MEKFINTQESVPVPKVEVEPEFRGFIPQEFLVDPKGYFEREGKNIKTGEKKIDENGVVREDPTAVKDLPTWKNNEGIELKTVARHVDTKKGKAGESGDPFYEYKIQEQLRQLGLPAAKPIAKAEQAGDHIIVMECIPGLRWSERDSLNLKEQGYSEEDLSNLMVQTEQKMDELKTKFEQVGVVRGWKLKDMVIQIDFDHKQVLSVIPTDWERTKII
ncbi:MAG: hypothetical protein AAB900_00575, partial [Patescibacteria group bacterium]